MSNESIPGMSMTSLSPCADGLLSDGFPSDGLIEKIERELGGVNNNANEIKAGLQKRAYPQNGVSVLGRAEFETWQRLGSSISKVVVWKGGGESECTMLQ